MATRLLTRAVFGSKTLTVRPTLCELNTAKCSQLHTRSIPTEEIQIPVQWGHISAKVWGDISTHRPIIALHGWQDNAGTWDPLAPMLIKDRAIVAIDCPGHGLSSWYPPGMQYFGWDLPRHILTLKEYFKLDKLALLCHSMGSIASLRYACTFPDDVEFFVGVDSLIYDDYDLNFVIDKYPKLIQKAVAAQTRLDKEPPSYTMEEIKQRWHIGTGKSVSLDSVAHLAVRGTKPSQTNPGKYYISRDSRLKYSLFSPEDKKFVEALIRRLKCPTLYIKAIDSPFANDRYSIEMCEIIEKSNPNFERHFVPGTHHVHLNNPELVAPLILNFLKKYNIPI